MNPTPDFALTLADEKQCEVRSHPPFVCQAGLKYNFVFQTSGNISLKQIRFFETVNSDFLFNINFRCRYSTHANFRNLNDETWTGEGIFATKGQKCEATFSPPLHIPKTSDSPATSGLDSFVLVQFEYLNPAPGPIVRYAWSEGFDQTNRKMKSKSFEVNGVKILITYNCDQVAQLIFCHAPS